MSQVIEQSKVKMRAAIEHLKGELKTIRTGRANPAMLEGVIVEVYGAPARLKEIASITAPDPKQLAIMAYDPKNLNSIAKGIEKANLGFNPAVDGNVVRVRVPMMDANQRQGFVKICHQEKEKAKVTIRNERRAANDQLKKQKTAGEIPEDQFKKFEKMVQDMTDSFCKEADDLAKAKEDEVMHI